MPAPPPAASGAQQLWAITVEKFPLLEVTPTLATDEILRG
jgi:hypothetical protein